MIIELAFLKQDVVWLRVHGNNAKTNTRAKFSSQGKTSVPAQRRQPLYAPYPYLNIVRAKFVCYNQTLLFTNKPSYFKFKN